MFTKPSNDEELLLLDCSVYVVRFATSFLSGCFRILKKNENNFIFSKCFCLFNL